jgi:hypothetical protein
MQVVRAKRVDRGSHGPSLLIITLHFPWLASATGSLAAALIV